ncbi:MAG: NADH-ubiquinone oxidoreductase-F iron-sulfur binding region domain-containing protein [Acidimicrobiales bacterium]|nr:hypothetical protein [Acidimicrobiales bacterium]
MRNELQNRVLMPTEVRDLTAHLSAGGARGWATASTWSSEQLLEMIHDSGLRGRGGAGFPTATKWRTTAEHSASAARPPTLVVNAAEGEPGSFKDRLLIRRNPYKVLEGALIAARAVGAGRVVVATKAKFETEVERLQQAIGDIEASSAFADAPSVELVLGPDRYLFGEETALLEVVAGRPPFPRVSPPWRHGTDLEGDDRSTAEVEMATVDGATDIPPTVVNNVETLAHVADIARFGSAWFRERGTKDQPGTMLCTITGPLDQHGVVEVPVGSTTNQVLSEAGVSATSPLLAMMPGVSHPLVPADRFDTPLGYGSGDESIHVGSGALRFFSSEQDPVAVAAGVARFLAVESCGQCTPCKADGLELADMMSVLMGEGAVHDELLEQFLTRTETVVEGARCALASQQGDIAGALITDFSEAILAQAAGTAPAVEAVPTVPLVDIEGGRARYERAHLEVNPDWTEGQAWEGAYPAQLHSGPQG